MTEKKDDESNYEAEWGPGSIFDLLGDKCTRRILAKLTQDPLSAKNLADECNVSLTTIYRRIHALQKYKLIQERTKISQTGSHYSTYKTNVEEINIEVGDGGMTVELELRDEPSNNIAGVWTDGRDE